MRRMVAPKPFMQRVCEVERSRMKRAAYAVSGLIVSVVMFALMMFAVASRTDDSHWEY